MSIGMTLLADLSKDALRCAILTPRPPWLMKFKVAWVGCFCLDGGAMIEVAILPPFWFVSVGLVPKGADLLCTKHGYLFF